MKGIKHDVRFMMNDDKATPTALVGKKIAPIVQFPDGRVQTESMELVRHFDKDETYGPVGRIAPASPRTDIAAWQKETKSLLRLLHRPRYVKCHILPEFQQRAGRDYFVAGHAVPTRNTELDKAWKEGSLEAQWEAYEEALRRSPELLPELNVALQKLEGLIDSPKACTKLSSFAAAAGEHHAEVDAPPVCSEDDIDLWSRLRSITLVKGAEFGPTARAYMEHFSASGDVPLFFCCAV